MTPFFKIPQSTDQKGRVRSGPAEPVDTGERPLTPSERAVSSQLNRQLTQYKKGEFDARFRPLFENLARIPVPAEWNHPGIHPAVYLTRFPKGPSKELATDCCEAMLAYWTRHSEKILTGEKVDPPTLNDAFQEQQEPFEERVSTPESREAAAALAGELVDTVLAEDDDDDELEDEPTSTDPETPDSVSTVADESQADPADLLREGEADGDGDDDDDDVELVEDDDAPPDPLANDPELGVHTEADETHEHPDPVHTEAESVHTELPALAKAKDDESAAEEHPCPVAGCPMVAASARGLTQHINAKHPDRADKLNRKRGRD